MTNNINNTLNKVINSKNLVNQAFWITNFSNRNVSLADLNITIKSNTSINLLDKKHHYYTIEQLNKSKESGSLYKKSRFVGVRQIAPIEIKLVLTTSDSVIPNRSRSTVEAYSTAKKEHDDLINESEEDKVYAEEAADADLVD